MPKAYVNTILVDVTDAQVAEGLYVPPATPAQVRQERDNILTTVVDPLVSNPLRWADLTSATQAEWSTYRQALLDVPQQAGFPTNITWPESPLT